LPFSRKNEKTARQGVQKLAVAFPRASQGKDIRAAVVFTQWSSRARIHANILVGIGFQSGHRVDHP